MDKKTASLKPSRLISNECMVEVQMRIPKKSPTMGVSWAPVVAQFMLDAFPQALVHTQNNDEWTSILFSDDLGFLDEGEELED